MIKLPTTEQIDAASAAFESYFNAVGKVVHAWNHLHEELGKLFCHVAGINEGLGMATWHSSTNDKAQRLMLEAAITERSHDPDWSDDHPGAEKGIRWILHKANDMGEKRNTAIHAPCSIIAGEQELEIFAYSFSQNPRAKKLRGKDILAEFDWYERSADALRRHVRDAQMALWDAHVPWPDKPRMPVLELGPARKERSRQSAAK
ncbi:MAG: hypothetical protein JO049_20530 [Hyphomicrobiales bacterium]|jgi:hypothetical protein|nr:hypothetical protein [Hyphomicrobiales bacterium]